MCFRYATGPVRTAANVEELAASGLLGTGEKELSSVDKPICKANKIIFYPVFVHRL